MRCISPEISSIRLSRSSAPQRSERAFFVFLYWMILLYSLSSRLSFFNFHVPEAGTTKSTIAESEYTESDRSIPFFSNISLIEMCSLSVSVIFSVPLAV